MSPLENIAILLIAANTAFILNELYKYINRCITNYQLKKRKYDQVYNKRCEKLVDKVVDLFLTEAINDPVKLSYRLAYREVNRLKKEGKIVYMYSKMRAGA